MIPVSQEFKNALTDDKRDWVEKVTITPIGGTGFTATNAFIWSGGLEIEDAVSGDNVFGALGATVVNKATIVLNDIYKHFQGTDFTGSEVDVRIGLQLTDLEMLKKGIYTVEDAKYNGSLITLECVDNMAKFDKPYSESSLLFPATLGTIVREACVDCLGSSEGLATLTFPNSDFAIPTRPDSETITYREVLSWCAQIAGCFARINNEGKLELKWFGDTPQHTIDSIYEPNVGKEDTVITGVRILVKSKNDDGDVIKEYVAGTTDFAIEISENSFITESTAQTIADDLGSRLIGLQFRKASLTHSSDPSIEAGDVAYLPSLGCRILVTRTSFSSGAAQTTVSASETPARNSTKRFSEATKNYVEMRKSLAVEKTEREAAVESLAEALAESSGLYNTTIQTGEIDPSTGEVVTSGNVFFLHDKRLLSDSAVAWKMTADAFGVTNNYQGTSTVWTAGLTVDGTLIAEKLSAVGVNADWINTGALSVKKDGKEIFYADVDSGVVRMSTPNIYDVELRGNMLENTATPSLTNKPKLRNTNDYVITYPNDKAFVNQEVYPYRYGVTGWKKGLYLYSSYDLSEVEEAGTLTIGETYTLSATVIGGYLFFNDDSEDYVLEATFQLYLGGDDYEVVQRKTIINYPAGDFTSRESEIEVDFSFTFTVESDDPEVDYSAGCVIEIARAYGKNNQDVHDTDSFITVQKLKLEKGSPATPWTDEEGDVGAPIDQLWAFNKLTNNGNLQGLFMENGNLYVNMSYLKTGELHVGGAGNNYGLIKVYDAIGKHVGGWNSTNLYTISEETDPQTGQLCERVGMMTSAKMYYVFDSKALGAIGTNFYDDTDYHGLHFDLDRYGTYMAWAATNPADPTDNTYHIKLGYTREDLDSGFWAECLSVGCDFNLNSFYLHDLGGWNFPPEKVGNINYPYYEGPAICETLKIPILPLRMNSNGTVAEWSRDLSLTFRHGLLIAATWERGYSTRP